jgi:hypothetical protein
MFVEKSFSLQLFLHLKFLLRSFPAVNQFLGDGRFPVAHILLGTLVVAVVGLGVGEIDCIATQSPTIWVIETRSINDTE